MADRAEDVDGAHLAGGDAPAGLGVAGILAALEADLQRHPGGDDGEGALGRGTSRATGFSQSTALPARAAAID